MISSFDLKAWKQHLKTYEWLSASAFSRDELSALYDEIQLEKSLMKKSFAQVDPPLNFNYPNFETKDHLPTMIQFLGHPAQQNTLPFENFHVQMKLLGANTNQKNVERDVLIQVNSFPFTN